MSARSFSYDYGSDSNIGQHPLIPGADIKLDDQNASVVLVFPKGQASGGSIDEDEIMEDAFQKADKCFTRKQNRDHINTEAEGFEELSGDGVKAGVYQDVVREKVVQVLQISGMRAESFQSLDGDEVYVKVSLKLNGQVIQDLAARYDYPMAFQPVAYQNEEPHGDYEGGAPMKNAEGDSVPGYHPYEKDLSHLFVPFSNIDEIRLILLRLDEWLDLNEMVDQKVLSGYFPAAKYEAIEELHALWADPRRMVCLPSHEHDEGIREYFGEEVAMFFRWFAFYVRMLLPLGIVGFIAFLRRVPQFNFDFTTQRFIQIAFGSVLVVWSALFNKIFNNRKARNSQRWGQKQMTEGVTFERVKYDEDLEGTTKLRMRHGLRRFIIVAFMLIFVVGVGWSQHLKAQKQEEGDEQFCTIWAPLMTAIIVKGGNWIWGKIAPLLCNLQNHRTEARYNADLTITLSVVKIFVALWPFIVPAFLVKYTDKICGDSVIAAALSVYDDMGWPEGVEMPCEANQCAILNTNITEYDLTWLTDHYVDGSGRCIFGCYPVECFMVDGVRRCVTNCVRQLESSLLTVYILHIFITVGLLVFAWVLVRWQVKKEMDKARDENDESDDNMYTLLQLQSKCHEVASYRYESSGGSHIEDFLDLSISFALLTCFGILLPVMAMIAFVSHMIEYRLKAYRMINITCRPIPQPGAGIGAWDKVFETISIIAITVNAALAVFVMQPIRTWSTRDEFLAFIALEHGLLALRSLALLLIHNEPPDVTRIEDFNSAFIRSGLKARPQLEIPEDETYDYSQLEADIKC